MYNFKLLVNKGKYGMFHMQRDLSLFQKCEKGDSLSTTICIYSWDPPCISFGYSQKEEKEIDIKKAKSLGWDIVKRPTGGGIVFHNTAEVSYSIITSIDNPILPKGLIPSYKKISSAVVFALNQIGLNAEIRNWKLEIGNWKLKTNNNLCFSYPTEYEIVVGNKKIVGSAQKRGRKALLQQGSIFVRKSDETVFSVLKNPYKRYNAISVNEILGREVSFEELRDALFLGFQERLGII
ncbi:hypothetical protein A2246_00020 [candidate division WOR-1 bacterium RIFOXYA2_FULL_37_7]|nr:MAG: hypothetical protein A2246_00020 [candidate division WOR-1 bacterium RIFOXYA2_FULL_37_7]